MAIKNINDGEYVDLYKIIGSNQLIQWYQRNYKYKFVLPIMKYSKNDCKFLDIGCARGDFLAFLLVNGYTNLYGLDVDNALPPEIDQYVTFLGESICDENLEMPQFDSAQIASVLHHLPLNLLDQTAINLGKIVKKDGYLYVYDVNRKSLAGRFFNSVFLRIFPNLYKSNEYERPEQEELGNRWDAFVSLLEKDFTPIRKSRHNIYVSFVGKKR